MALKFAPVFMEGTNLDDCWFQLLEKLFAHGRKYHITDGSYAGQDRLTFDFVSGFVHFPHARPLAPQIPAGCTLPPPTTDEEIEQYFANYLMDSNLAPNEDYRYATWIVGGEYKIPKVKIVLWSHTPEGSIIKRPHYEFNSKHTDTNEVDYIVTVPNQLQWVIDHFKQKGLGNNHGIITMGYPESNFAYDIPYSNETERRTSPCLRSIDLKVIDKKYLMMHVYFRSWDLVGGWPTNMGGLTLLNEYVANELDIEPGPLAFSCKDLHAYDHSFSYLKARLNK